MTTSPAPGATLVRARIHPRALDHMSRYFDATASSVYVELIQNARRAGASHVDNVADSADEDASDATLDATVQDNGPGIDDPRVLLSFGESDWDGDEATRAAISRAGLAGGPLAHAEGPSRGHRRARRPHRRHPRQTYSMMCTSH